MSDDSPPVNKMRGTTKAGLGIGGLMVSIQFLMVLKGFMGADVTHLELTMKEGFQAMGNKIDTHVEDEVIIHRRLRDLNTAEVAASELRCDKKADDLRIDVRDLQRMAFKPQTRSGLQN